MEELIKQIKSERRMILREDPIGAIWERDENGKSVLRRLHADGDNYWAITSEELAQIQAHYEAKIVDARIDGIDKAYRLLKPHMDRSFSTDDLIVTRTAIAHLKKEKH